MACFVFLGHASFLPLCFLRDQHKSLAWPELPQKYERGLSYNRHRSWKTLFFGIKIFVRLICSVESNRHFLHLHHAFVLVTDAINYQIDHYRRAFSYHSAVIAIPSSTMGLCLVSTVCHHTCLSRSRGYHYPENDREYMPGCVRMRHH